MNKHQWNSNQNINFFIHENISENIVCEMADILSLPQYVNGTCYISGSLWLLMTFCIFCARVFASSMLACISQFQISPHSKVLQRNATPQFRKPKFFILKFLHVFFTHTFRVHTGQGKVSEKLFFSRSGKSQGILRQVVCMNPDLPNSWRYQFNFLYNVCNYIHIYLFVYID